MSTRIRMISGKPRHLHGYRRGFHDPRDYKLADYPHLTPVSQAISGVPPSASTRALYQPPVRDQGALGSCTANAGCTAAGYLYHQQTKKNDPLFSRLMLYATTRKLEGTPLRDDSGAYVRDVFKAMSKSGVCFERTWPYRTTAFSKSPSAAAVREGKRHKALIYLRCDTLTDIINSIASGFPVIGGFTCFESLDRPATAATGLVPLPADNEAEIGGHCVYFDSYDALPRCLVSKTRGARDGDRADSDDCRTSTSSAAWQTTSGRSDANRRSAIASGTSSACVA